MVTDVGTSRKPILALNLLLILHRFQVMVDYVEFSLASGCRFTLTPSLGTILCEYRHK